MNKSADMRFEIRDPYSREDILGGPVSGENVYITTYSEEPRRKGDEDLWERTDPPLELKIGEKTWRAYTLSKEYKVYVIERIA